MTARVPFRSALLPWGDAEGFRRSDAAVVAVVGVYGLLAVLDASTWVVASALDDVLYALITVATIVQTARVAFRTAPGANRIGWVLLLVNLLLRFGAGFAWGRWAGTGIGGADPSWLAVASVSYLVALVPALLVFPSARWRGRDALRARIDAATVLLGTLLVVWFLAIGPLLRSPLLATAPIDDLVFAFGDSLAVIVVAGLFLRADTAEVRRAAGWLVVAFALRLAPDLIIWKASSSPDFSPFSLIGITWFAVWVFQWAAARAAESVQQQHAAHSAPRHRYESGALPETFLIAAVAMLLVQLTAGEVRDSILFALGSAVLTLLLVARQGVELDERDRLANRIAWEGARFKALLHHAYDAVALIGRDGRLRYASPGTSRVLGDRLESTAPADLISLVHEDDRAALLAAFADEETPVHAIRVRLKNRLDRWRTFDGHLHDHRRDPLIDGFVLHGIDRTREYEMNEGLQATQPLEALGVLAGGLAHDLNNILTVVVSHGELLAVDDTLDARARVDVDAIRVASDRARSLTTGLLTLSRRKDAVVDRIDVPDAVRTRMSRGPTPPLDVAEDGALHVRVDAGAMSQVLDAVIEVAHEEAHGDDIRVFVGERAVNDAEAMSLRLDPRLYVTVSAGTGDGLGVPDVVEDAVRTEEGDEWDLAPGDLALLIGLAACREVGGTIVRERRASGTRLVALLPAVHQ